MLSSLILFAVMELGGSSSERVNQQEPAAASAPTIVLDRRGLRSLSMDLLGRPPFAEEARRWLGKSSAEFLEGARATTEFWQHWLDEQLYYFLLVNNFRPESEGVQSMPAELAAGKLDVRAALHRIALSSNFEQRNPGADTFVTVVMEQLGGLDVKKQPRELEIGKKVYDGNEGTFLGVSGNSQADVIRIVMANKAFARHFIGREYERIVHTRPDAKEWSAWATELHKDPSTFALHLASWVSSSAYAARIAQRVVEPNRIFVRALFVDLLGRLPLVDEAEPMREALDGLSDPTPLRSILVRQMLDSGRVKIDARDAIKDARGWTREQFVRFLAREPSANELEAFAGAFHDPSCRPATILLALLTSPEYQQY